MNYIVEEQTYQEFFIDILRPYLDDGLEIITYLKVDSDLMRDIQVLNLSKNRIFVLFTLDEKFKEQNMLLKTLEEEEHNHFVLVVLNKENLLPTVVNRCIYYKNTKPRTIEMNEEIQNLVDKVVNDIGKASTANLFVLVKKVEEINCAKPIEQFLGLLTNAYGVDPKKYKKQLMATGKSYLRVKNTPILSRQIFTVLLLDLKEFL